MGTNMNNDRISRERILNIAREAVCTDRNLSYGEPEQSFEVIAELWRYYLEKCCVMPTGDVSLGAREAAEMMILFKMARLITASSPKADTYADIAGYAACAGELAGDFYHEPG